MLLAAFFMAIVATSTAGYAYLVGPVLKSLFMSDSIGVPGLSDGAQSVSQPDFLSMISQKLSSASPVVVGLLLVIAAVVKGVAFFLQRFLVISAGQHVLYSLRQRLFDGVLQMNPLQRAKDASGTFISRFTVDAHVVEQAVTQGMMALVGSVLQIVALTVLALSLSWELGLLGLVAFPPIAVLISRLGKLLRVRQRKFYDAYNSLSQVVDESVSGVGVLQSYGAQPFARKRFEKENASLVKRAISAFTVSAFASPLNEVIGAMALGMTLWYAQVKIETDALSPEAFISFFTALFLLYRPVKGFGNAVHALQIGLAALDKLEPLMKPLIRFDVNREDASRVELEGVDAGYGEQDAIIAKISLQIEPGQKVAIIGESGAGKTTLLNVLCGYATPKRGTVKSPWPVAYVPQVPFLFDDSIAMNVTLGNPAISQSALERACQQARVLGFTDGLTEGLQYRVGPNGKNLSAGERQRICLARALATGRKLLLLDEVTASLDGKNEELIIDSLSELREHMIIAVTHRAKTAAWADRTIVMHDGKIIEAGSFFELVETSNTVRRMFGNGMEKG